MFVSVPCLQNILEEKKFHSYLLLIDSIYTLLKDEISRDDIDRCEYNLLQFVGECEILYGSEFITYNVQYLLHYCVSVRKTGPLWANSVFSFEDAIYYFTRHLMLRTDVANK